MSNETAHRIAPTTSATGEVQFQLPIDASLIASFEAVDLDLMLISTTGEKFILQQGALQAAINPNSKLLFNNGESLSAADQIKRLGVLKPVEGGSFRLASASLPDSPEIISGNEFGLGKEAQDTAAKIEKILQALEAATQSNTADTPHSTTANGGTKTSSREAAADPLASPSPGAPPAPEEIKNTHTSDVKVNSTVRAFTGNSGDAVSGVLVTAVGSNNFNPSKSLSQVDFTQIDASKTIKVDLNSRHTLDVEAGGKATATITLPGVFNAKSLVLTTTATLPDGFTIDGKSFVDGKLTITNLSSLTDLKLPVSWEVGTTPVNNFSVAVKFFDGATALDYGNAPLNFYHANNLPTETLDSNSNTKLFLSNEGYSYDITGTSGNNDIKGGSGNDRIDGGLGADSISGGAGNDIYFVDNSGDVVSETTSTNTDAGGTDTVNSFINYTLTDFVEKLTLTGVTDINGTGNGFDNTINGNDGNNILDGKTGADTMSGGTGNDTYFVDNSGDVVSETTSTNTDAGGTDTVNSFINYTLTDFVEKLTLTGVTDINGTGNGLDNTINGNDGNNILDGKTGADTMSGGAGDDTYLVDNAADVVTEVLGAGTDTVSSSIGYALGEHIENLTLAGTGHIDGKGNTENNLITGNIGNNRIDGVAGADTMAGGLGDDIYVVDNASDAVTEALSEGTDTVEASVSYNLSANVEKLTLTGTGNINGTGNELANILTGNSGNNSLDGGSGADTMVGGAGNDTYVVDNAGDLVNETATQGLADTVEASINYTLTANVENLTLMGEANINGTGNTHNNSITGNSGNNSLDGGAGADTMFGGAGNDTYVVDNAADGVTEALGAGTDTVVSSIGYALGEHLENITLTGTGHINGTGNELANILTGNSGNNRLDGGVGNDTMVGGAGDDTYMVDSTGDLITEAFGAGTDTVESSIGYTLTANVEHLTLAGTATIGTGNGLNNTLTANNLGNTLSGGAGTDTLIGGDGVDRLDGGTEADSMRGGADNDTYLVDSAGDVVTEVDIQGTADTVEASINYTLTAHVEKLILTGTAAINGTGNDSDNTITGNSGNNSLTGGVGADTIDGGGGINTASYTASGAGVTVSLVAGATNTGGHAQGDVLSNIHNLLGSAHADNLTGDASDNRLEGGAGNDALSGGAGTDTLIGGAGADSFNGGDGVDTVSYAGAAAVNVSLATGATNTGGDAQGDTFSNVENLIGSSNNDTLTGDSSVNRLDGADGDDRLDGGGGVDTLVGGAGNDTFMINNTGVTIEDSSGNDTVESSINFTLQSGLENLKLIGTATEGTGNSSNNIITGNNTVGNNVLKGEAGDDTLVIESSRLSMGKFDGGTGTDTLKITASAGAVIDLTGISNANFLSIEKIDLSSQANNILKINLSAIQSLVDAGSAIPTLKVRLGTNDSIEFVTNSGQVTFDNTSSKILTVFGSSGGSLVQQAFIDYA